MKNLLLLSSIVFLSAIAQADGRDYRNNGHSYNGLHCNCVELERRLEGLQNVLRYFEVSSYEARSIDRQIDEGQRLYRKAYGGTSLEQARDCALGAQAVDRAWVRWQPDLARAGYDHDHQCYDRDDRDDRDRRDDNRGRRRR